MQLDLREYGRRCRLLDGAWGTELVRQGLLSGTVPELLNVERPEVIAAVARSYVEAGSEIILTNTFSANRFALERHGASERVEQLATAGVRISRAVAGAKVKVFATIGPTGRIIMMEEVSSNRLRDAFTETARAIVGAVPDAIVLEAFSELEELRLALQAVKASSELPVVACMSFSAGEDATRTVMGNRPEDLVRIAEENDAEAVGANCGIGPEAHVNVAQRLRAATKLPIWIKPNAGIPQIGPDGKTRYPVGPEEFAAFVPRFLDIGVNFLGGCCGATPDHIRAVKAALRKGDVEKR